MDTTKRTATQLIADMNDLQASLRATKAAQKHNVTNDLGFAVMCAVARRIASQRMTDKEGALKDYDQAISCMTVNEVETFNQEIVWAAIEMGG